ncbi:MAG TPA: prolipoprotein diacylglyceryl transferase [Chryseolinea sp.]
MHPILFEAGGVTVYSYGVMIAVGCVAGVSYMALQGKKETGLTFDQANALFLWIFAAAFVGGKVFLFFEDPSHYLKNPLKLVTGRGFVFYGSFLFTIPTMLWFFKKQGLNAYKMLDVMAVTTCLVHMFGRLGCFLAGCCHGRPTDAVIGVTFTDPACYAKPLDTPLFPTQLMEAGYIFVIMMILLYLRDRRKFSGQLFLVYIMLYAIGRGVLEIYRGDGARGFIIEDYLSHSQLIALLLLGVGIYIYRYQAKKIKYKV